MLTHDQSIKMQFSTPVLEETGSFMVPDFIFSLPGQSPGRAIVLPPALAAASALAKSLTLKFFM